MAKKTSKKTTSRKTSAKKTSAKKATKKKTSKRSTAKKTASKKKTSKRSAAKKTAAKKKTSKATSKRSTAKKKATKKKTSAKKTSRRSNGKKRTAQRRPPRSVANADECQTLEECRGFIRELADGAKQMNDWLNELHDAALSAEQARDHYAEQVSDLVEALDQDQTKIAQLESELRKARQGKAKTCASEAVLTKLDELSRELSTLRADFKRITQGRALTTERKRRAKSANGKAKAPRRAPTSVGPFPKYSVLSGAACSLGVGKHGYAPEVCAPGALPRSEAARVLGQYAQNDYAGLAEWATITGLPISDAGALPAPSRRKAAKKKSSKKKAASGNGSASKKAAKKVTSRSTQPRGSRSNQQVLNQVLLTIQRI